MAASAAEGPKGATPMTEAQKRAVLDALPFGDTQDFEDARRGFLGSLPEVEIVNEQGRVIWSLRDYAGVIVIETHRIDKVARLFTLLDDVALMFEVVEPKRA